MAVESEGGAAEGAVEAVAARAVVVAVAVLVAEVPAEGNNLLHLIISIKKCSKV